jgi:hypothetical protein
MGLSPYRQSPLTPDQPTMGPLDPHGPLSLCAGEGESTWIGDCSAGKGGEWRLARWAELRWYTSDVRMARSVSLVPRVIWEGSCHATPDAPDPE